MSNERLMEFLFLCEMLVFCEFIVQFAQKNGVEAEREHRGWRGSSGLEIGDVSFSDLGNNLRSIGARCKDFRKGGLFSRHLSVRRDDLSAN